MDSESLTQFVGRNRSNQVQKAGHIMLLPDFCV